MNKAHKKHRKKNQTKTKFKFSKTDQLKKKNSLLILMMYIGLNV